MRFLGGLNGGSDLRRNFHSTPDLNVQAQGPLLGKGHRSQEDVNAIRNGLPPPTHPPPPPPVGQVVKVNVGASPTPEATPASVYDNMAHIQQVKGSQTRDSRSEFGELNETFFSELAAATAENNYGVMSSFRPANSAKLYASPEDMKSVGYRSLSLPGSAARSQLRKSHSLRTPNGGPTAASFKSGGVVANGAPNGQSAAANGNQYAQPLKTGRSHSVVGVVRERKKKGQFLMHTPHCSNTNELFLQEPAPTVARPRRYQTPTTASASRRTTRT